MPVTTLEQAGNNASVRSARLTPHNSISACAKCFGPIFPPSSGSTLKTFFLRKNANYCTINISNLKSHFYMYFTDRKSGFPPIRAVKKAEIL